MNARHRQLRGGAARNSTSAAMPASRREEILPDFPVLLAPDDVVDEVVMDVDEHREHEEKQLGAPNGVVIRYSQIQRAWQPLESDPTQDPTQQDECRESGKPLDFCAEAQAVQPRPSRGGGLRLVDLK